MEWDGMGKAYFDVGHFDREVDVGIRRFLGVYACEELAAGLRNDTLVGSI